MTGDEFRPKKPMLGMDMGVIVAIREMVARESELLTDSRRCAC